MKRKNEKPILFSANMVNAILEGRKTQTRRIIKVQPPYDGREWNVSTTVCSTERKVIGKKRFVVMAEDGINYADKTDYFTVPYHVGQLLWVRENFYLAPKNFAPDGNIIDPDGDHRTISYTASMTLLSEETALGFGVKHSPSIHMPKWASRIWLRVTGVYLEQLTSNCEADAEAEGRRLKDSIEYSLIGQFAHLWDALNEKRGYGWMKNPWVWVVKFEVLSTNGHPFKTETPQGVPNANA